MQTSKVGSDVPFISSNFSYGGTGKSNYVTLISANQISKKGIVSELQENAMK